MGPRFHTTMAYWPSCSRLMRFCLRDRAGAGEVALGVAVEAVGVVAVESVEVALVAVAVAEVRVEALAALAAGAEARVEAPVALAAGAEVRAVLEAVGEVQRAAVAHVAAEGADLPT